MKARILYTCALLSAVSSAEELRRSGTGTPMLPADIQAPARDVTSDEALIARRTAAGGTAPRPVPTRPDGYALIDLSTVLSHGGNQTLLPKGSVIYCPEAHAEKISGTATGKPMPWQEFLHANRGWIVTREVSLSRIRGEQPFTDAEREAFSQAGCMVVATFRGAPVTVLSPPTPVSP